MKSLITIGLVASVLITVNAFLTQDFVSQINSLQSQWTATTNNMFSGMTTEEIKQYLGTKVDVSEEEVETGQYDSLLENVDIPESFNSQDKWPECIHPIRNQAKCGSCWAFGAAGALSDRLCIATNGRENHVLSPQWMVSCDKLNLGCNGGILPVAWFYLQRHGIPTEQCLPYTSSRGERGECPKTCVDGTEPTFYRAKSFKIYSNVNEAKLQILTNGPIETGFIVFEDFIGYQSGVYKYTAGKQLGGHAIRVVGWGVQNGTKYWIAANSWGESWGENGFFRIQEGECSFERQFIGGPLRV